jgi:hypothetical protein
VTVLTAVYLDEMVAFLFFLIGMPSLVLSLKRTIFKAKTLTVEIEEDGFRLIERDTFVPWDQLVSFYFSDYGRKRFISSIQLKLKNGKKMDITYFRKFDRIDNKEEWYRFTDCFFTKLKEHCPNIGNYYDSPAWNFYIYFLVGIIVLLPVVFIILKVKMTAVIGPYMVALGTSLALISQIISNRRKGRLVKSGLKKRETK